MRSRIYLPFLAFAIMILTIGLSCGGSTAVPPTVTVPPPTLQPTNPPPPPTLRPTNPPPPPTSAPQPTETLAPTEAPAFFTDDFTGDLSNWSYYVKAGNEDKLTISTDQGGIVTRLDDVDLAVYFYYEPYLYNDVILDMTYRNQGRNSNNVNVVCRYSDAGWYEFTVQNDGLYQIWAFTDSYHMLASGASTAIKIGQDSNEITVGCVQNVLTLFINGFEIKTIADSVYFLGQGQVGFGVNISAMNPVTPVIVSFDTFTIAEPK
jgi:hypothetical protein